MDSFLNHHSLPRIRIDCRAFQFCDFVRPFLQRKCIIYTGNWFFSISFSLYRCDDATVYDIDMMNKFCDFLLKQVCVLILLFANSIFVITAHSII